MENETNVQSTETTAAEQEKTFTQAELDATVAARLARERKKYPADDELSAFRTWKDSQETEQTRWSKLTEEREETSKQLSATAAELEQARRELYVLKKGVKPDDADFYAFKAGKMVTDKIPFEQAVDELLKDKQFGMTVSLTAPTGGGQGGVSDKDRMNALLRSARK